MQILHNGKEYNVDRKTRKIQISVFSDNNFVVDIWIDLEKNNVEIDDGVAPFLNYWITPYPTAIREEIQ